MRKIYYLLLMVCTIGAFSACSDDDNGENAPQNPVTGYSVPAQGNIGEDVTIKGQGYTADSKIFLKDTKEEKEMTVKTFTNVDLVFTVPGTMVAGTYAVVLHQAGGNWELGKIALIATAPVKDCVVPAEAEIGEVVTVTGKGFAADCEVYLKPGEGEPVKMQEVKQTETGITFTMPAEIATGNYALVLRQDGDWTLGTIKVIQGGPKRLTKFVHKSVDGAKTTELSYDGEGRIGSWTVTSTDGLDMITTVVYGDGKVTLTTKGKTSHSTTEGTTVYNLDTEGKVTDGEYIGGSTEEIAGVPTETHKESKYTFTYTPAGFLENIEDVTTIEEDAQEPVNYAYKYESDNMVNADFDGTEFNFSYEGSTILNNVSGIDMTGFILEYFGGPDFDLRLLGICGKYSVNMPTSMPDPDWLGWGDYTIGYTKTGNFIGSITLKAEDEPDEVYEFYYESYY